MQMWFRSDEEIPGIADIAVDTTQPNMLLVFELIVFVDRRHPGKIYLFCEPVWASIFFFENVFIDFTTGYLADLNKWTRKVINNYTYIPLALVNS